MNPMALVSGGEPRRGRCLGEHLTAYADRAMDPESLRFWDRHLVACTSCRGAVDAERRVLASLRSPSASAVPGELRGMLLALASALDPEPQTDVRAGGVAAPPVPVAPVPVIDRGMPAFHRSARRATVFAGLAAGATAAAAWSLALTGGAVATATPSSSPGTVQRTRPATQGFVPAAFVVSTVGLTPRAVVPPSGAEVLAPAPGVSSARAHSAESTP
jgi:hypothetical protein